MECKIWVKPNTKELGEDLGLRGNQGWCNNCEDDVTFDWHELTCQKVLQTCPIDFRHSEFAAIYGSAPRPNPIWTTAAGEALFVSDMETPHLQNTIIWLTKKQNECAELKIGLYTINDRNAYNWISIMKAELKKRGVIITDVV